MTDREKCFECCGREWLGPARLDEDSGLTFADRCGRCLGSGFDPESDRYRTEAAYEEAR